MRGTKGALGPAVVIFVAILPGVGCAQSSHAMRDTTRPAAEATMAAGMLSPAEIVAAVERAGFDPIAGPVQHGRVYVVFALDPNDGEVKLTVDASSGRVVRVTGIAGTRFGGPGYYGYRAWWRYERPLAPPGDIPNVGPGRSNSVSVRTVRPSPPLPRTRPADLTRASAKETAPPGQNEHGAPLSRSHVAPTPAVRPAQPTMAPIAPLE